MWLLQSSVAMKRTFIFGWACPHAIVPQAIASAAVISIRLSFIMMRLSLTDVIRPQ